MGASFDHVSNWMLQIKQYADLKVEKVLIGNKCDLTSRRAVTEEDGRQLAQKSDGIPFFECSAKMETNVKESFETLARKVLSNLSVATPAAGSGRVIPSNK